MQKRERKTSVWTPTRTWEIVRRPSISELIKIPEVYKTLEPELRQGRFELMYPTRSGHWRVKTESGLQMPLIFPIGQFYGEPAAMEERLGTSSWHDDLRAWVYNSTWR
jgi:hypothetical protein